jgi:hypothetical protein
MKPNTKRAAGGLKKVAGKYTGKMMRGKLNKAAEKMMYNKRSSY